MYQLLFAADHKWVIRFRSYVSWHEALGVSREQRKCDKVSQAAGRTWPLKRRMRWVVIARASTSCLWVAGMGRMNPRAAVMSSASMPRGGRKEVTETTSLSDILADCMHKAVLVGRTSQGHTE